MPSNLPANIREFMDWPWEKIEPYFQDLNKRSLNNNKIDIWLADWSQLLEYLAEMFNRLYVATTVDTTDEDAEQRYNIFLDNIFPKAEAENQKLKEKLLASGLQPEGFEVQLRNMRSDAEIFREQNLPLQSEDLKLGNEYDKIIGTQTIIWEGEELTIAQLKPFYQDHDRAKREQIWRLSSKRQLSDRETINKLWLKFLELRLELAHNSDFQDYRSYRWRQYHRFDYTPEDAKRFDRAIEEVVVPLALKIYNKRQEQLGVHSLRPWDLDVDPLKRDPLKPFDDASTLIERTADIFYRVDPQLGGYFNIMREEKLLDLENRKGKAPGGYCIDFPAAQRPFIFMNAVGTQDDVQTLLHEGGHAFHVFESAPLPYFQQKDVSMEFAEVASMSMEFLSAPYLSRGEGGFYSQKDAARARIEHLEGSLLFWPYMAVVDLFQHWVYENPDEAAKPANCDTVWGELWDRYMVGVDYRGLEDVKVTGWQRKLHIHQMPFYYIEYGMAQLGAVQVWNNALQNQTQAVQQYRHALSLGGTVPLPGLFAAAGARFAFSADTLRDACRLIMDTIDELEHFSS